MQKQAKDLIYEFRVLSQEFRAKAQGRYTIRENDLVCLNEHGSKRRDVAGDH